MHEWNESLDATLLPQLFVDKWRDSYTEMAYELRNENSIGNLILSWENNMNILMQKIYVEEELHIVIAN